MTGVNDSTTVTRRGWVLPCDGTTGYVEVAFSWNSSVETTASRYGIVGIMLYENGTGKSYNANITKYHAELYCGFGLSTWTNDTTRATSIAYGQATWQNAPLFLRARVNGANVELHYSTDRITWTLYDSTAKTGGGGAFTTAPDRAGVWVHGYNTVPKVTITHFKIGS
jgi:hypothetical protein